MLRMGSLRRCISGDTGAARRGPIGSHAGYEGKSRPSLHTHQIYRGKSWLMATLELLSNHNRHNTTQTTNAFRFFFFFDPFLSDVRTETTSGRNLLRRLWRTNPTIFPTPHWLRVLLSNMIQHMRQGRSNKWEQEIATLPFEEWGASCRVYYVRTRGRKNRGQEGAGVLVDRIVRRKGCNNNLRQKSIESMVTTSVIYYFAVKNERNP